MVAPAARAASTSARVFSSMPVCSITPLTAPWSAPPSEVKSFWYSISTTAVLLGSMATGTPSVRGIGLQRLDCTAAR